MLAMKGVVYLPLKYYGLFSILAEREMKKTDLLKFVSSPTIAKLSKHERVSLEVIETLCDKLDVQPGDIVKFVREESPVPPPSPDEPPKPKDRETKSETGIRSTVVEPKHFTIPEDKIPKSIYFEREDVEMPRGFARYLIPSLGDGKESIIVKEDDLGKIESDIARYNEYLCDDSKKEIGYQMVKTFYTWLRARSLDNSGELAG